MSRKKHALSNDGIVMAIFAMHAIGIVNHLSAALDTDVVSLCNLDNPDQQGDMFLVLAEHLAYQAEDSMKGESFKKLVACVREKLNAEDL